MSDNTLLPNPSVITNIKKLSTGDGHFLATGEGGFIKTEDNGVTWKSMSGNKNYRFYFDVLIHPDNPDFWVTAGWDKKFETHQPLIVEASLDAGQTWQRAEWSGADQQGVFGGVWSMKWADANNNIIHMGTYKGGLFTVKVDIN